MVCASACGSELGERRVDGSPRVGRAHRHTARVPYPLPQVRDFRALLSILRVRTAEEGYQSPKCLDCAEGAAYGECVPEVTSSHRRSRGDPSAPLPRRKNLPAFRRTGMSWHAKEAP